MNIPENLKSANKEFIAIDGKLFQIQITMIPFNLFSNDTLTKLNELLEADPIAQKALYSLGILNLFDRIEKFAICNYGGYDNEADITAENVTHEHYNCLQRGNCKMEGKLCKSVKLGKGYLTSRELEICRLIGQDKFDKEIADILKISINTVNNHMSNIHQKTGLAKPGIAAAISLLNI